MKNTILWSALFTLIGTQVHAELSQPVALPTQAPNTSNTTPAIPAPPSQNSPSVSPAQPAAPIINCEYKIPAETKKIEQSLVVTWSEKAVIQAFDFSSSNLDDQLQKLQPCFTEQGWTGFNTALKKSGNLDAIKAQKLTVSSQIEGQVVVTEAKDNEWKLNLPLQVVYQNDKEKVTQLLSVDLTVSRKVTGDLGITQMIAAPREPAAQENATNTVNTNMNPASSTTETTPTPSTATPEQTAPSAATPGQAAPGTTTPGQAAPGTTTPEQAAPGTTTPGQAAPGTTTPGQTAPGTATPGQTAPSTTTPEQTAPGTATPGQAAPGTTTPEQTAPGTATPGQAAPGTATPGQAAPSTATPGQTNQPTVPTNNP